MFNGSKKELMMGSTIRDLGNTLKQALKSSKIINLHEVEMEGEFGEDGSQMGADSHLMSACQENAEEEDVQTTMRE